MTWMLEIQARSLLLLAVTGIALFVLRRASAALRHLILSLAAAGLLALPVLSLLLPSWSAPVPALRAERGSRETRREAVLSAPVPAVALGARAAPAESGAEAAPSPQTPAPPPPASVRQTAAPTADAIPMRRTTLFAVSAAEIAAPVFALWSLGTVLLLLHLALALRRTSELARQAQDASGAPSVFAEPFSEALSLLGMRRSVRLLVADADRSGLSPLTWGLLRPVVLLPAEATAWERDRLRPVLLHELAHVRRGDWGTEILGRLVCALYWPNPLVWLLVRRLRKESEHACDDSVLLSGVAPADYAGHLLEVVRSLKARRGDSRVSSSAIGMAHKSGVESRVRAILAPGQPRRQVTVRVGAAGMAAVSGLLLPLASLRSAVPAEQNRKAAIPSSVKEQPAVSRVVTLPGGIRAEFLPVRGVLPDGTTACWQPDGTTVSANSTAMKAALASYPTADLPTESWVGDPAYPKVSSALKAPPSSLPPFTSGERVLAVRVSYPTADLADEAQVAFGVKNKTSEADEADNPPWFACFQKRGTTAATKNRTVYSIRQSFPADQQQVDMVLRVATGPRTTVIAGPPTRATTRRLSTGETAQMSAAYRQPTGSRTRSLQGVSGSG